MFHIVLVPPTAKGRCKMLKKIYCNKLCINFVLFISVCVVFLFCLLLFFKLQGQKFDVPMIVKMTVDSSILYT